MNPLLPQGLAAAALALACLGAQAHGDEAHGDAPHAVNATASSGPRFEAATEAFELVGRLEPGALTLFVHRFASSEPLGQAQVEVESGALQALATYQPASGSHVVRDARLLAALAQPGEHALVLTVTAGDEADLLEATLHTPAAAPAPAQTPTPLTLGLTAAALAATALGAMALRRRRASPKGDRT